MKITVKMTTEREITIPGRFLRDGSWYYMILNDVEVLQVVNLERQPDIMLYPSIKIESAQYVSGLIEARVISEAEFKLAFLKVSLELEKSMN